MRIAHDLGERKLENKFLMLLEWWRRRQQRQRSSMKFVHLFGKQTDN